MRRVRQLPQERLIIVLQGIGAVEWAGEDALAYVKQRQAFGRPIRGLQNTRFRLAEAQAMVVDEGLQPFGGYGDMLEYALAELVVDACVQRTCGGTNELMKEPAARSM